MSRGGLLVWRIFKWLLIPAALAAVGFFLLGPYVGKTTTPANEPKELSAAEQAAKELEEKNAAERAAKKEESTTSEPKISVEQKKSKRGSYDSGER